MVRICRDLYAAGNCALTGMIVITSGCATYEPWASALGGVVGGLIILPSSLFVSHVLKIDDPVDAFAVRAAAPQRANLQLVHQRAETAESADLGIKAALRNAGSGKLMSADESFPLRAQYGLAGDDIQHG